MIRCPNCNRQHPEDVITCDCGYNLQAYVVNLKAQQLVHTEVARPYRFLPYLLFTLQGIGFLSILAGVIYALKLWSDEASFWLILAAFLAGILGSVPYFAFSEALAVLLHVSEKQDKLIRSLDRTEIEVRKS